MIAICLFQVWWRWAHAPLRTARKSTLPPKIARRKRAKSSVTQPWISLFRSNYVWSLHKWHPNFIKISRSRGQSSKSQRDITCAKIREISSLIQPRIARFRSNFVQTLINWRLMYHKLSRSTGQKSRSQCDVTYQHRKNAIIHAWISCRRSNFVKIIPQPSTARNKMFKVIRSNTKIAITSPRIARFAFKFGTEFCHITGATLQVFKVKGQKSKVIGQVHSLM